MSTGDHVPRRRGSSMYHHGQDQQYYFLRDLDDEHGTGFSFPEMISSHDTISSISTTAAPMPLIFNDGSLTINQLPNYTTTTTTNDINSFLASSFSDYGLIRQPAAADLYDLGSMGSQLVNKDGRIITSIMDTNARTSAAAAGGGVITSRTATPLTGNSSISSPSTEDGNAATEDQEDLSSSSRILICNNNNTTSTINKGDYVDHMDDEEQQQQQQMDIKGNNDHNDDDTATATAGDESKKLFKPRKKGEKRQREPRFAFMTKSEVDHLEDGYRWRKYGQKAVKNSAYPRSYYRCTAQKCSVKKRVERSYQDPSIVITTYEGQHTHQSPATVRGSSHILVPPPLSTLTMPLSSFHRDNNHLLKLHQLMNTTSTRELGTAAVGAIFNSSSIITNNNTNYLQSLIMSTSDTYLQGQQQLHQVLLPAAAADHYGLLQDHVANPSSFNINSNGPLP